MIIVMLCQYHPYRNSRMISELSNWSSEYNYNKITDDFKEFYEDMNPIVLK